MKVKALSLLLVLTLAFSLVGFAAEDTADYWAKYDPPITIKFGAPHDPNDQEWLKLESMTGETI